MRDLGFGSRVEGVALRVDSFSRGGVGSFVSPSETLDELDAFRVSCFVFRVSCSVFRVSCFRFCFSFFAFRVSGFGFMVSGLGV